MKLTVGQQLRNARETRGLSLDDAVKATHIRLNYLQELEGDHPELFLSAAQARGFLRLYASFLDIPYLPLLAQWDEGIEEGSPVKDEEPSTVDEEIPSGEIVSEEKDSNHETPESPVGDSINKKLLRIIRNLKTRIPKFSNIIIKLRKIAEIKPKLEDDGKPSPEKHKVPSDTVNKRSSTEIFRDIGLALRERRSALELSLTDIEQFTNVKYTYLNAMEEGYFEKLPSTVQGRGMLNNYAKFLALDETWIMDAYAKALQSQRSERTVSQKRRQIQPPLSVKLNIPEKWRGILNLDLIIGGFFILVLFIFIIWGGAQVFRGADPTPTEAPSISEMLQQSPTVTHELEENGEETAVGLETTPIPGITITESTPTQIATVNAAPLQLYIIAHDRAFLRVIVDGFETFDGRVLPDNVYTYSGEKSIDLVTGNGAALEVYFNQEYLGNLGKVGEVVNISFSLEGLSTPTPEASPSPTPDLRMEEGGDMEEMDN